MVVIAGMMLYVLHSIGQISAIGMFRIDGEDGLTLAEMAVVSAGGVAGMVVFLAAAALVHRPMAQGIPFANIDFDTVGLRARGADLRVGVIGFLLIFPIVLLVNGLARAAADMVARAKGTARPDEVMHATLDQLQAGTTDVWWWLLVLMITISTPIYEELLFRGYLQSALLRLTGSARSAIVITSVIFVAPHIPVVEPHGLIGLFVLSLGFGVAMERTGRLAAPMLMHALFNAVNIGIAMM